jgi:hypothetical protein
VKSARAIQRRIKNLQEDLAVEFDKRLAQYVLTSKEVGMIITRNGPARTIRECVPVSDDEDAATWDTGVDKRLGRSIWVKDEHCISNKATAAAYAANGRVGPTPWQVQKGIKQLDASIHALGVEPQERGMDDHEHSSPAVVTNVSALLQALIAANRYISELPSRHRCHYFDIVQLR